MAIVRKKTIRVEDNEWREINMELLKTEKNDETQTNTEMMKINVPLLS